MAGFPPRIPRKAVVKREWLLTLLAVLHVPHAWHWLWELAVVVEIDREARA